MTHLAVPSQFLEPLGLNSVRYGLGGEKIVLGHLLTPLCDVVFSVDTLLSQQKVELAGWVELEAEPAKHNGALQGSSFRRY